MKDLQTFIKQNSGSAWISNYHQRPAQLFEGVLQRLSIFITDIGDKKRFYTSGIYRWYTNTRIYLFPNIFYQSMSQDKQSHVVKVGNNTEKSIFEKYACQKEVSVYLSDSEIADNTVYYRTAGGGYWVTFLNAEFDCIAVSNKYASFKKEYNSKIFSAAFNSNLFWWYYSINYDLFNFKDYMIFGFQLTYPMSFVKELGKLSDLMENSLRNNAVYYQIKSKTAGVNQTVTYQKHLSKNEMDEIDKILAKHYGFTEEELDFIINYDIKYRMGDELNEE